MPNLALYFARRYGDAPPQGRGTPKTEANIQMEANRPKRAWYCGPSRLLGFRSQFELNQIRHFRDVANSCRNRGVSPPW